MKKRVFLFIIVISILLITSCVTKKQETVFENLQYSENIEIISNYFKDLKSIDRVYFKCKQVGSISRIGPSTYKTTGFIYISKEEMNTIRNDYLFEDTEPHFPSGISTDITKKDSFSWQSNDEFSRYLLKGNFIGDIYIDIINNIIFFDIENT